MIKIFKTTVSAATILMVAFSPFTSLTPEVLAADSGFISPSVNANSSNGWDAPQNAYASDNSRASDNANSDIVQYYNFGFSVPGDAIVNGIEVKVEGYTNNSRQAVIDLSWNGGPGTRSRC